MRYTIRQMKRKEPSHKRAKIDTIDRCTPYKKRAIKENTSADHTRGASDKLMLRSAFIL